MEVLLALASVRANWDRIAANNCLKTATRLALDKRQEFRPGAVETFTRQRKLAPVESAIVLRYVIDTFRDRGNCERIHPDMFYLLGRT